MVPPTLPVSELGQITVFQAENCRVKKLTDTLTVRQDDLAARCGKGGMPRMSQQQPSSLPEGGKARRVYLLLRDEISSGSLQVGTLLPGEQRMAETYGVSRVTIRRALEGLAMDGLIQKKTGAGSIVLGRAAQDGPMSGDITSLMPQVVDMGRETTARLLSFSYDRA